MCLAIPMKLIEKKEDRGIVELSGVKKEVSLKLMEEAEIGDYLIIHAGFAIQKLNEEEARETLQLWKEMEEAGRE